MSSDLRRPEHGVLREYPIRKSVAVHALGNHGGFSGARLWRVSGEMGDLCLRAWPVEMTRDRLEVIHALMSLARSRGLDVVPEIVRSGSGETFVQGEGRLWELVRWLPGVADFHQNPLVRRVVGW